MTVVDQSAQPAREYDFWKVKPYGGPTGTPPTMTVAGMGWEQVSTGTGVTQVAPGSGTAANFGNIAGRIRAEELNEAIQHPDDDAQGVIRHAITISVECHSGLFTPPALQAPALGKCDGGHAAPMGARLYLPSSFAIDTSWHSWQKVILRTIKQYGLYINDTGAGGVLFNMQKEGGLQYLVENSPNNWWQAATGSYSPPTLGSCEPRGWQGYTDGGTFQGCAAHFDQSSQNQVPLTVWTQLRVAALTVDRAVSPSSGTASGGQSVTLHGTGLRGGVQVAFGAATVTGTASPDGTSVTVVTPPHAAGPVDLTVTSSVVGQSPPAQVTLPAAYTYAAGTSPPAFTTATPPTTAAVGVPYTYKFVGSGNPAPTYALVGGPNWLSIDATTGIVSGTPPAGSAGSSFSYSVSASNSQGTATAGPFTVAINSMTSAPVFTMATPPTIAAVGNAYSYKFVASGNPAPTYALVGGPNWLSIDATTGIVSGTPPAGSAGSSFSYSVTASNSQGTATVGPFTVAIKAGTNARADLSIQLTAPASAKVEHPIHYKITVTNLGPDPAHNITVRFKKPNRTVLIAASGQYEKSGKNLRWRVPSLSVGTRVEFGVIVNARHSGKLRAVSSVASTIADPNPSNNHAVRFTHVVGNQHPHQWQQTAQTKKHGRHGGHAWNKRFGSAGEEPRHWQRKGACNRALH